MTLQQLTEAAEGHLKSVSLIAEAFDQDITFIRKITQDSNEKIDIMDISNVEDNIILLCIDLSGMRFLDDNELKQIYNAINEICEADNVQISFTI